MLQWGEPLWLLLLPLLPVFAWWLITRGRAALPLPSSARLAQPSSAVQMLAWLPLALRVLTLTLIVLALARPRTAGAVLDDPAFGVPIVVAVDLSSSMLAEDIPPTNRLHAAKEVLSEFIGARESEPIGLVAFASEAITVAPVTTYRPVLLNALQGLEVGLLPDGTAIGEGLAIAVNRVRDLPARERVVVLMSDGENNRGVIDPREAAAAAATLGIRVFTIGVGAEGASRVPTARGDDVVYAELQVGLDETLLRDIADATGGLYFRATDRTGLRAIYAEIDQMVSTPLDQRGRQLYDEWYLPLLLLAGMALAAEWLLRGSRWGVLPG